MSAPTDEICSWLRRIGRRAGQVFGFFLLGMAMGAVACAGERRAGELAELWVATLSPLNREVVFAWRRPQLPAGEAARAVLVLVPGYNGDGRVWLQGESAWTRFADEERLVLVGPTFQTNPAEIRAGQGYYYPAQWSGRALLAAVEEIGRRERVPVEKLLLFGFSAGAHFTHRFALWQPGRVRAFVAYSAAWWEHPTVAARAVPGLLVCGEEDPRLGPTQACLQEARRLGLPWIGRSYAQLGHEIRPPVLRMAQVFLQHYLQDAPATAVWMGDAQTYQIFPEGTEAAERIPQELRVRLPSRAIAEVWHSENP